MASRCITTSRWLSVLPALCLITGCTARPWGTAPPTGSPAAVPQGEAYENYMGKWSAPRLSGSDGAPPAP
jgi:hypothetical protein